MNQKINRFLRLLFFMFTAAILTNCINPEFKKEELLVTGVSKPEISLNGTWKIATNPTVDYISDNKMGWRDILVPGEPEMQGYLIRHNKPFVYKRIFVVPADYAGLKIKIRFDGVYSFARVWVNGVFIRDHTGGFTSWGCDITNQVKPGKEAVLTVEVTDMDNEVSYASGYAKHQIGGILRNVTLTALPENCPENITIQPVMDEKFTDADLMIKLISHVKAKTWVNFRLYDKKGVLVNISDKKFILQDSITSISLPVRKPEKWDSEHPNLYTLVMFVFDKSKVIASVSTRFGFRKIEVKGNKLLVNGEEVKLRGACRHDMDPLLGRMTTKEEDKEDVLLAKEANMNFIRTSHYPPSESFLDYCDEYGIYIEDESAVCFTDTHRGGLYRSLKQSGPEFEPEILSQLREMVVNHRNHPSVIIWSSGNENSYNDSFRKSYEIIKTEDGTRPVMFSYPGGVPDSVKCYDIVSMHYPAYNGNLEQRGIKINKFHSEKLPVLYDEWAHVACYNKPELLEDPNVRNFWGQSLDSMWTNVYESDGGAGGAIWGMIDETFMLPDTLSGYNTLWGIQEETNGVKMIEGPAAGYGEWGIVDTWRRKKPEFWSTKKAYSPIKILSDEITDFKPGSPIQILVQNRFNHTNLKEIFTKWTYRNKETILRNHNIDPHKKGHIQLASADWHEGEYINIKFFMKDSSLIDEYNLRLGKRNVILPESGGNKIKTEEIDGGKIRVTGAGFSVILNKGTGCLENIVTTKDTLIKSGPFLHYRYPTEKHGSVVPFKELENNWKVKRLTSDNSKGYLIISSTSTFGKLELEYNLKIFSDGIIIISYTLDGIPDRSPVEELGIRFLTGGQFNNMSWDRRPYWNAYPPDHPGRAFGNVTLDQKNDNKYREKPGVFQAYDNKSFYYDGLSESPNLSYLARSMKENIYSYSLSTLKGSKLSILSSGDQACRISKNEKNYNLYVNKFWDYNSLNWGNYTKNLTLPQHMTDTVYIKIN